MNYVCKIILQYARVSQITKNCVKFPQYKLNAGIDFDKNESNDCERRFNYFPR